MTTDSPIQKTDENAKILRTAALSRMKHAISEAQNLIVVLDKIKNGKAPIQEMAVVRGCAAKLCQSVHEASAYFSAFETVDQNKGYLPLSRPHKAKEPKTFVRKRIP